MKEIYLAIIVIGILSILFYFSFFSNVERFEVPIENISDIDEKTLKQFKKKMQDQIKQFCTPEYCTKHNLKIENIEKLYEDIK